MRNITVNPQTNLYAIFGDPIQHAMSPVIQNSEFDRNDLDNVMVAVRANLDTFDAIMPVMKTIGLKGYVFTMPVKEAAVKYMDSLSPEAAIIGAVNCAVNTDGKLTGYNTDSIGFGTCLEQLNQDNISIDSVFMMGAGGMSRAAIAQCSLRGIKNFYVANKKSDTAFIKSFSGFLERLKKQFPEISVKILDWIPEEWEKVLPCCQLAANCTPNGMYGVGDLAESFPYQALQNDAILIDAIYKPLETDFIKKAKTLGHKACGGLDILVNQGASAFTYWTGLMADPEQMKKDIMDFWESRKE